MLCALPFFLYNFMLENLGFDVVLAGNVILVGYVGLGTVLWTSSYIFRVANKDMTYAQQLRDYENAVIQKRFEELSEDEVDALMGEICASGAGSRFEPSRHGCPLDSCRVFPADSLPSPCSPCCVPAVALLFTCCFPAVSLLCPCCFPAVPLPSLCCPPAVSLPPCCLPAA